EQNSGTHCGAEKRNHPRTIYRMFSFRFLRDLRIRHLSNAPCCCAVKPKRFRRSYVLPHRPIHHMAKVTSLKLPGHDLKLDDAHHCEGVLLVAISYYW